MQNITEASGKASSGSKNLISSGTNGFMCWISPPTNLNRGVNIWNSRKKKKLFYERARNINQPLGHKLQEQKHPYASTFLQIFLELKSKLNLFPFISLLQVNFI